jgi:septal ring factor EnvC (AmiA/AmiB activator)
VATPAPGALTTADIGRLDWPVEGTILYPFGRETRPSGAVIRWTGIGIGAPAGTPVHAVAAGRVALVQRLSTYGLTVILEHGDSHTSLYMQLQSAAVSVGQQVTKGQQVGAVGGGGTERGPHLHFEIRQSGGLALDPAAWLRGRR